VPDEWVGRVAGAMPSRRAGIRVGMWTLVRESLLAPTVPVGRPIRTPDASRGAVRTPDASRGPAGLVPRLAAVGHCDPEC
jgi:hypothetical protein